MSEERWIVVPDFPGYRVSNMGRVQTRNRPGKRCRFVPPEWKLADTWRDMKGSRNPSGHRTVTLRYEGTVRKVYIHQLVLELFVGPCPDGLECCHEDDNPENNRLDNLRWDTHGGNMKDMFHNGSRTFKGESNPQSKLTDAECEVIRQERAAGVPLKIISERFGVSKPHISQIASGKYRAG